jgi:hypothetical protein
MTWARSEEAASHNADPARCTFDASRCPTWVDAVEKVPNCFLTDFSPSDEMGVKSLVDVTSDPLPESAVSSSLDDEPPTVIFTWPSTALKIWSSAMQNDFFDSIGQNRKCGRLRGMSVLPLILLQKSFLQKVSKILRAAGAVFV